MNDNQESARPPTLPRALAYQSRSDDDQAQTTSD